MSNRTIYRLFISFCCITAREFTESSGWSRVPFASVVK